MGCMLVLEDEESVNRGITFSLEKAGHEVWSCGSIAEAKRVVDGKSGGLMKRDSDRNADRNANRNADGNADKTADRTADKIADRVVPDLVICDINLPDGSGLEFIKWLRREKGLKSYVICLTALDQELDQVMGYESGADDYVTKPFSLSVLMLKIDAYVKRNTVKMAKKRLCSGNLAVNQNEMRLEVQGQEISLTKNEWKLLNYFLLNPKQILSKQQILENVFDIEGTYVDENTLAVNIRRLREKIEEDTANPSYIKNIRGLGYIWNQEVK